MNKGKLIAGIVTLIVVLLVFGIKTCHGQVNKTLYHSLEASYIVLNAADLVTTYKVIKYGGREVNPTMKPFIDNKFEAIAFKTVATLGILALNRQIKKDHPKLALWSLVALNVGMGYVVQHNYTLTVSLKINYLPSHPSTP